MAGNEHSGTTIVSQLACSLAGQTITLKLTPGSRLEELHGDAREVVEHTTCNYGLDPQIQGIANGNGMIISAVDETGEVRAIERPDHPWFFGTLYQPQLSSAPGAPHPLMAGLVAAAQAQ